MSQTFLSAIAKDLPVLFVYIAWGERYDGTEPLRGNFKWVEENPEDNTEAEAFRKRGGLYACGLGAGVLNPTRIHVVFCARDPISNTRKIVAVYANALIVQPDNGWPIAETKTALLLAPRLRPNLLVWPGSMGMRRWAKRPINEGKSHPELYRYFKNLRRRIMGGGLGPQSSSERTVIDTELHAFEGVSRTLFVKHRKREARLRYEKIRQALCDTRGRLLCEVPECGFDFAKTYGERGAGYIHVHHLKPLSTAGKDGQKTRLQDLAVVCANCHAMIHRNGECHPLKGLIQR